VGGVEEVEGWVAATTSDGLKLLRSLRSESRSKSDSGALRAGTGGCGRKERNTSHTHTQITPPNTNHKHAHITQQTIIVRSEHSADLESFLWLLWEEEQEKRNVNKELCHHQHHTSPLQPLEQQGW